ncbi:MAG: hypothetical protein ACON5J_10640 [Rubripirellula sp.]
MNNKEMTDREVVRRIARATQDGGIQKPSYYIEEAAKAPYKRQISHATVTRSIGAYADRVSVNESLAKDSAKELLVYCKFSMPLAEHVLHKAFLK